jgi:spore coat polysaccharide biosynthesis protein SpsF (cytidylyltransferase family)
LTDDEREHIVYYFCHHSDRCTLIEVRPDKKIDFRFTVDTPEDLTRMQRFIEHFDQEHLTYNYANFVTYADSLR